LLFLATPRSRNSRIPAAKAMSLADNFLQKQQKQRECRFKKGRGGDPLGGSRNRAVGAAERLSATEAVGDAQCRADQD